uniref:TF_AP-2 domain-containing protein n=1 Tax=Panagrellus redivivus TaxID=6233 RepID=A0A7E4VKT9_PANRE
MIRNPLADMLIMAAQNQANHPSDGTNQPDYAAILRAAFPQQYPTTLAGQAGPSIEIKPEDEESVPSPSDTVDRAESPASTTESLPKEAENGSLKRPAAIQELLLSKRARLSKTAMSNPEATKSEHSSATDTESSSSTDSSTPSSPPASFDPISIFLDFQRQILAPGQLLHARIPTTCIANGATEHPNTYLVADNQVFTQVPSRLTLLAHVEKYDMTVGEIRRRVMGPETFNFSALGALLRRAKLPSRSSQLAQDLAKVGLSVARGRRRSGVTTFSCLTEGEARKFAHDFDVVTQNSLPVVPLAEKASDDFLDTCLDTVGIHNVNTVMKERRRRLEHTREMVKEFMNLLEMDRSPVLDQNPEPIFPENLQDEFSTFSMLTHGFGVPGLKVGIKAFQNFIDFQIANLTIG